MDIVCRLGESSVAIDLIGYPGEWQDYFDMSAYKLFRRAGLRIVPLPYGLWLESKQQCVDKVLATLKSNQ